MITIIIDKVSDWEKLRERSGVDKKATFYTQMGGSGEPVLVWFIKEGIQYSVRAVGPLYEESIKARIHDSG